MRIRLFDYIKVIMKTLIIVTHVPVITAVMRHDFQFPLWIDQAVPFFWIISAFLFNLAFHRHGSKSPKDELSRQRLFPRLNRILIPYCAIFFLMLIYTLYTSNIYKAASGLIGLDIPATKTMFIPALFVDFVCGGNGPGGYYIPMLFQMYLLLPFLCFWYQQKPIATIICTSLAIAIWEALAAIHFVSPEIYRLVLLREGFYLLAGIVISSWYVNKSFVTTKHVLMAIFMTIIGALYLIGISNWGWPPLSGTSWQNTSTLSFAYVAGLMILMIAICYKLNKRNLLGLEQTPPRRSLLQSFVETISKAALHIYIFQMLYYYVVPPSVFTKLGVPWSILASIIICTLCGFVHYRIDSYIKGKMATVSPLSDSNRAQ